MGGSFRAELDVGASFDMMSRGDDEAMERKQVHLVVHGRVQHVYFRASTQHEAHRLGVVGWVKNLPDGSVEILAEGQEEALKKLVQWAHQGPRAARVDRVDVEWRSFQHIPLGFRIIE
jgi:acylphosphatase